MIFPGTPRVRRCLPALLCICSAVSGSAYAGEPGEFWPEVSAFVTLGPRTRMYLDAAYAREKESVYASMDMAVYLDISLKPIVKGRQKDDWQRSRYLWARIGYDHVSKVADGTEQTGEDRGIVSIYGKVGLPAEIWAEMRLRTDLRWIGGDFSTRYRAKLEMTREFTMFGRTIVPYINAEWFWDTRHGGLSRLLWQAGPEITVNQRFRYEIFLSRQFDYYPNQSSVNAVGFVAKWYF